MVSRYRTALTLASWRPVTFFSTEVALLALFSLLSAGKSGQIEVEPEVSAPVMVHRQAMGAPDKDASLL
jgi:hypothetical protein